MIDFLRATAAILFVFGLVVFIHELGHFIAAKMMGVYAPRFSIGFGPPLWARKWRETEYMIAVFPLGGYVRMASRDDETMAFIEGGAEQPVDANAAEAQRPRFWDPHGMAPFGPRPVPADRWFESKSFPARLFILVAGVTMNIVLGFVVYTGMALAFGQPTLSTRVIGAVTPLAASPQLAALAAGDTILALNGVSVATWNDFDAGFDTLPGDTMIIRTQRASVAIPVAAARSEARARVLGAIQPFWPSVLEDVVPGTPAERAGLHSGDSVIAVDGTAVRSWQELVALIKPAAGRDLRVTVVREGTPRTFVIRPDTGEQVDPDTKAKVKVGKLGIGVAEPPLTHAPLSFVDAVRQGAERTWFAAGSVVLTVRMLATGAASFRQVGGPVAIGSLAARAAKHGLEQLLNVLAFISVNVAVFNLLPIPLLDGGQILMLAAERIKGGALSMRTREYLMRAGLAIILLLLVVVLGFNDLPALYHKLFGP